MGMGDIWNMGSMSGDTAGRESGVDEASRERDLDLVVLGHRR